MVVYIYNLSTQAVESRLYPQIQRQTGLFIKFQISWVSPCSKTLSQNKMRVGVEWE